MIDTPSTDKLAEMMWEEHCPGIRQTSADKGLYSRFAHTALKLLRPRPAVDVAGLVKALEAAAQQFRHYEALHKAKIGQDATAKMIANRQMAEMCEAALSAPGWRPINSAPKDGTPLLLHNPGDDPEATIGGWCKGIEPEALTFGAPEGWYDALGPIHPTHWQPLPAAPSPAVTP